MKRGCLTCRHARYRTTPTGRLKKGEPVKCLAPQPTSMAIKAALQSVVPASMLSQYTTVSPWPRGMWPDEGDDGACCCAWEPRT